MSAKTLSTALNAHKAAMAALDRDIAKRGVGKIDERRVKLVARLRALAAKVRKAVKESLE